jgi:hypothetical protein
LRIAPGLREHESVRAGYLSIGLALLAAVSCGEAFTEGGSGAAGGTGAQGGSGAAGGTGAHGGAGQGGGGQGGCRDTLSSVAHCGACGRACNDAAYVQPGGARCVNGLCRHACEAGWLDCTQPAAPDPDDGCETLHSSTSCGCGLDCTLTMGTCAPHGSLELLYCDCSRSTRCGDAGAVCETGRCKCYPNGFAGDHCAHGETCTKGACSCNGGAKCTGGTGADGAHLYVCCPGGCANLRTSALNCGACGVACPPDFECVSGACTPQ